ncbi:cysteine--tRNA ligase [Chlamydia abortus]|uniref:cysteine--tRNA ligase n=1 Tax=Chlamydia abortus TaxID=83555 RepID=UPI00052A9DF6|nr:cysteine--tRNA ligase [Chlamydia abortus]ASD30913.1 cysteine--tRNA ligase [Chlamydia abortus]QRR31558.1 cysteine--tRNA ligase [Chlamydia abortus]CED80853.1 putative cysteinyl-tRNA synthetase [Chlamydia abortus]CED81813.1 putative cysteinyl-tRNA synthetase [Chlamydia abortus]CEF17259.1 putative cysteinyl-tRNA synthetase [Chlamydia abortus]
MRQSSDNRQNLYLYNTASRTKELFSPSNDPVKLYTCGPTVYDYAHIGNFRTYIFEDLLKRILLFFGYSVKHVMNITDVDDKTLAGACKNNISLDTYTAPFIQAFFEDVATLHILPADAYPRATHYIPQMLVAIRKLLDDGIAYIGQDHSVYFSIKEFPSYGKLSQLQLQNLQCCSRIASDEYDKENLSDFVLWKAYDKHRDGHIYWESPFGKGRPGWHLECSIMAMELLGPSIDIHAGGVDNIFPHHENEIAQSESLSHQPFSRYWLHSEHLLVDGKKMSKSLGNFFTLRNLLDRGFSGAEIRYMLLQSHYRMQLNFTEEGLMACRQALKRLRDFISRLESPYPESATISEGIDQCGQRFLQDFSNAIANDLNIAAALASLFDFIHQTNSRIDQSHFTQADSHYVLDILKKINTVLGVIPFSTSLEIPSEVARLVEEREIARKEKNWKQADVLRNQIASFGYVVEDTKSGPKVKKY